MLDITCFSKLFNPLPPLLYPNARTVFSTVRSIHSSSRNCGACGKVLWNLVILADGCGQIAPSGIYYTNLIACPQTGYRSLW